MLCCLGSDSIASQDGSEANMSSLACKLHEDSVSRPHFPSRIRDEKNLGDLGLINPTVMITRTRSVWRGGLPLDTGVVNRPTAPCVGTLAAQGTYLVPQPVCSNRKGTGTFIPILERKTDSIFNRASKSDPASVLEPVPVFLPVRKKSSTVSVPVSLPVRKKSSIVSVSYTHLTLPTILLV